MARPPKYATPEARAAAHAERQRARRARLKVASEPDREAVREVHGGAHARNLRLVPPQVPPQVAPPEPAPEPTEEEIAEAVREQGIDRTLEATNQRVLVMYARISEVGVTMAHEAMTDRSKLGDALEVMSAMRGFMPLFNDWRMSRKRQRAAGELADRMNRTYAAASNE